MKRDEKMDMRNLPYIDLEELELWKKENFKERLAFIDLYTKWLKKNKENDV